MASLRAELTALLDRARADGSKVVAIEAIDLVLRPRHQVAIDEVGGWEVTHPRACVDRPHCDLAAALATAHLLSAPYAMGRTYQVWQEDGATALSFLDTTGREP